MDVDYVALPQSMIEEVIARIDRSRWARNIVHHAAMVSRPPLQHHDVYR
jgi:hypothetical protein